MATVENTTHHNRQLFLHYQNEFGLVLGIRFSVALSERKYGDVNYDVSKQRRFNDVISKTLLK